MKALNDSFDRPLQLSTPVETEPQGFDISHSDKIVTVGSCFADTVGERLRRRLFDVEVNPMGILFNPASICRSLHMAIEGKPYSDSEIFEHEGSWHSPDFHSAFSADTPRGCLQKVNEAIRRTHQALKEARILSLTFGSTHVFTLKATGAPVANCHKLPADRFEESDLTPEQTVDMCQGLLDELQQFNPELRIILTVSPVRHKAYGLHRDRLSKSALLLAADRLLRLGKDKGLSMSYFPAYEILTDELRDYRYYDRDLVHPSELAADIIFRRLGQTYFSGETRALADRCHQLMLQMAHRPLGQTEAVAEFARRTRQQAAELLRDRPELAPAMSRVFPNLND